MRKLVINGGKPLKGEVTISGAKNSTVALIPAAIIAEEPVVLEGVPDIQDVAALIEILNDFNVKTEYIDGTLTIDPTEMKSIPMPKGKIQSMRASYYFMGATLAKFGEGVVGLPGGCFLGPRPIDQHLKGFEALGATIIQDAGFVEARAEKELEGNGRILLRASGTENLIRVMVEASSDELTDKYCEQVAKIVREKFEVK